MDRYGWWKSSWCGTVQYYVVVGWDGWFALYLSRLPFLRSITTRATGFSCKRRIMICVAQIFNIKRIHTPFVLVSPNFVWHLLNLKLFIFMLCRMNNGLYWQLSDKDMT
jgi:hypothetical protein